MAWQNKLPDPFPIPQFRACTQEKLDNGMYLSNDRTYMVRVLATMLLAHVARPSKKDCAHVAMAFVQKYPFLDEHVSISYHLYL